MGNLRSSIVQLGEGRLGRIDGDLLQICPHMATSTYMHALEKYLLDFEGVLSVQGLPAASLQKNEALDQEMPPEPSVSQLQV